MDGLYIGNGYFYYLLTTCLWVLSSRVEKKAAELMTMGTQQKTISWPLTIHPSRCTGGCWFTVARQLQVVPKHPQKQQLMDVSGLHKTNCLDRQQLRRLTSHGAGPSPRPTLNEMSLSKGACYQTLDVNLLLALPFKVETLPSAQKGSLSLHSRVLWSSL